MANVTVLNTTNQLSGKTLTTAEGDFTVSGAWTFSGNQVFTGNVQIGNAVGDTLTVNGTIISNLIFTDNTYDIGASGATRPRDLYLSRNAVVGGTLAVTGHVTLEGVTSTGAQGSGALVFATSPTLTTPVIGDATGASIVLTGALTAGAAIIPPSTTASTIAASISIASATGITLADDATATMAMNTGLVCVYDATNGEGAFIRVFNNNVAIINQSGASLWVTTNTDTKNSIECSAGTLTLRNRSGAGATYRMWTLVMA